MLQHIITVITVRTCYLYVYDDLFQVKFISHTYPQDFTPSKCSLIANLVFPMQFVVILTPQNLFPYEISKY